MAGTYVKLVFQERSSTASRWPYLVMPFLLLPPRPSLNTGSKQSIISMSQMSITGDMLPTAHKLPASRVNVSNFTQNLNYKAALEKT
jgi:hypothetical protein